MTGLQHHPTAVRRHPTASAPVQKSGAMPVATSPARPVAVQVRMGGRWIAGQELGRRTGAAGADEVLVSHHGHLVWVDQQSVRGS
ncbi:hypothetical protein E0H73_28335 [Kribbella pittospori]|uniref:Uncharacterized protein n=2 Tax=Kribbella pittospori TaxID=722689 RepID=A0A4R0KQN5_9ACTN|nr:hypothetical protein E0H73_28335 [Kribbella pittospori]